MALFEKEKNKDKDAGGTDEPQNTGDTQLNPPVDKVKETPVSKSKENVEDGVAPKHDPKFSFVMRALSSFQGSFTQDFGYPVQTKLSQELIQHLTNYMENGSIEN